MESVYFPNQEQSPDDKGESKARKAKAKLWLEGLEGFKLPKLPEKEQDFKPEFKEKSLDMKLFVPPELAEIKLEEDDEPKAKAETTDAVAAKTGSAGDQPATTSIPESGAPHAEAAQAAYDEKFADIMSREAQGMDSDFVGAASGDRLGFTLPEIGASLQETAVRDSNLVRNPQFLSYSRPAFGQPEASRSETPAGVFVAAGGPATGAESVTPAGPNLGRLAEAAVNIAELARLVTLDPRMAVARLATRLAIERLSSQSWFRASASEQLANLQKEQSQLRQRLGQETSRRNVVASQSAPFEQLPNTVLSETLPPLAVPEGQKFVGADGEEIIFQPGWRLERSGAYYAVLDQHNRLVQYAIPRGAEFWREQGQEAAGAHLPGDDVSGAAVGAGQTPIIGPGSVLGPGQAGVTQPSSAAQADQAKSPAGTRNTFVAAATSPWLWAAVAGLVIAFFVAQLI